MQVPWGLLTTAVGVFMLVCGLSESQFIIYRLLVARSRMLWGDNVHRFYQVVGVIVALFGVLVALGYF